ncbi:MAG: hypothetical protein GF387_01905 [Candidatus Portnoybacteria bacterium]|nr:hypothetical protein [Candidatus Portnoybacteria bacterium]
MSPNNKKTEQDVDEKIQQIHQEQEEERAKKLASDTGFPYKNLKTSPIDETGLFLIDEEKAKKAGAAIVQKKQKELYVGFLDPSTEEAKKLMKELEDKGYSVEAFIVSRGSIDKAWSRYKNKIEEKKPISKKVEIDGMDKGVDNIEDLREKFSDDLNTTELLNLIMAGALKLEASDVHFEAESEKNARIRIRIDGILRDLKDIPFKKYDSLISRIKILSELKLNITKAPQDGRFSFSIKRDGSEKEIEVRTSIIPGPNGENIVLRILDPKTIELQLEDLGIQDYDFKVIQEELKKTTGMIVTTGPTGSGKTTLLYSFLKKKNSPEVKIITLENPIEYHLEGVEQTQVNPDKGYTFAAGLRSIVRQDPDIILVGEIRDNETAKTAINAALTGHLVFSTLHTNDAAGAIPRLMDMKVSPKMIPASLNLVIAQRLVRKVCPKCSKEVEIEKEGLEKLKKGLKDLSSRAKKPKLEGIKIKKASEKGCPYCNFTGYKGRIGVFELFVIDDEMEKLIIKTPSIAEIKETAIKAGMVTMKQDGFLKVTQKITTIEEIERVLG